MSAAQLLEPILINGTKNTNFFNGLLLTAEALRTEQAAQGEKRRQLGRAIGDGVVFGFTVTAVATTLPDPPAVRVTAGLAINRKGEAMYLASEVPMLSLVRSSSEAGSSTDSCGRSTLFAECAPTPSSADLTNTGLYILTVMPASGYQESAPMAEVGSQGLGTACGRRYVVQGIKFRLVPVVLAGSSGALATEMAALATQASLTNAQTYYLRNGVAHLCYGTPNLTSFGGDPFATADDPDNPKDVVSAFSTYGLIDDLRTAGVLIDCDVPLAMLYWTKPGVRFLDMWSVRRCPVRRLNGDLWPLFADSRRQAEAEAAFLQFQDQLLDIASTESQLSNLKASDYFRYLPSAGALPVGTNSFSTSGFFTGFSTDAQPLDSAFLRLLFEQSFFVDAIDVKTPPVVYIYSLEESQDYIVFSREQKSTTPPEQEPPPTGPTENIVGSIQARVTVEQDSFQKLQQDKSSASAEVVRAIEDALRTSGRPDFLLYALGSDGRKHYGKLTSGTGFGKVPGQPKKTETPSALFVISSLDAGSYTVKVESKYFKPYSKAGVTIASESPERVDITLVPIKSGTAPGDRGVRPGKGDTRFPGGLKSSEWWKAVAIVPNKFKAEPWPPPDPGPDWYREDPGDELKQWLQDWGGDLGTDYPGATVDPANIQVYRDPSYTPASGPTENPYAYVVFGENGSYAPLVLVSADSALPVSVSTVRAGLDGIDRDQDQAALEANALNNLDVLANAWTSLVSETLNVSNATSLSVMSEARGKAVDLNQSADITMLGGVTQTLAKKLSEQFKTITDIANAEPAALVAAGVPEALAGRMVDQARAAVPASAWSLDSPALGFKASDREALSKLGVTTIEGFKASAETNKSQIATALGIHADQVSKLVAAADKQRSGAEFTMIGSAPSTTVFGVNSEVAVRLAGAGFETVASLATAKPEQLASAFNGDKERAAAAISGAAKYLKNTMRR